MSTIFVSYARKDAALVQALADDLRELGNTVWLDEEVSGGQAWWDHILEQIRNCEVFVFALSPAALESLSCGRESDYAAALGRQPLTVLATIWGCSINMAGTRTTRTTKSMPLASSCQTLGGCMIGMATFGNGLKIGMAHILQTIRPTQRDPKMESFGFFVAGPSSIRLGV